MRDGEIWIAGVDGCRGGWMVVTHPVDQPAKARVEILATFAAVIALPERPRVIAIDIPIGLLDRGKRGGRDCDIEARAPLGQSKSSVFPIGSRAILDAENYDEARLISRANSDPPLSVSIQAFNILDKTREIDSLMTATLQKLVVECHPEFIFYRLNGHRPLLHKKKKKAGEEFRWDLLAKRDYSPDVFDILKRRKGEADRDDVIDACAAAACAADILRGVAIRVPDDPPLDAKGLRMEIWG